MNFPIVTDCTIGSSFHPSLYPQLFPWDFAVFLIPWREYIFSFPDFELSQETYFGQWDISRHDSTRSVMSLCHPQKNLLTYCPRKLRDTWSRPTVLYLSLPSLNLLMHKQVQLRSAELGQLTAHRCVSWINACCHIPLRFVWSFITQKWLTNMPVVWADWSFIPFLNLIFVSLFLITKMEVSKGQVFLPFLLSVTSLIPVKMDWETVGTQ